MLPQSESPRIQPTSAEMKVTDSGRTEAAVKSAPGGEGEGDGLGASVGAGVLADGEAVACAFVGATGRLLQPASSAAATTMPSLEAGFTTVERGMMGPDELGTRHIRATRRKRCDCHIPAGKGGRGRLRRG